mgnify:CR=1 FL=1
MAYRVSNIAPIDLKPRIAIGISIPFNGSTGFNSTYTTADQLKTNIISFLLTNKGERLFQPTFGADLRKIIFNQNNDLTIDDLKKIFSEKVEAQFPQIKVTKNNINPDIDRNTINISFSYAVLKTNIKDDVNIILE